MVKSVDGGLTGGGDDRHLLRLVVGAAKGQPLPLHLPATCSVHGKDRGTGRALQLATHEDLHRQDLDCAVRR